MLLQLLLVCLIFRSSQGKRCMLLHTEPWLLQLMVCWLLRPLLQQSWKVVLLW